MNKIFPFIITLIFFISCKNENKQEKKAPINDTSNIKPIMVDKTDDPIIDSIIRFKPATLSIASEHSDMDALIPVGYNDHGSFCYIIDQDMGGAAGYEFNISPTYDQLSVHINFDREEQEDSVFYLNKDLIREAMQAAKIQLKNSIDRITLADLEKKYGIQFTIKKTFGPPNTDWDATKKTLAAVNISYHSGDGYPTQVANDHYETKDGVWDKYISDVILVPSKDLGMFAFVVLVTESIGFEGYTRKEIRLVSLGSLNR